MIVVKHNKVTGEVTLKIDEVINQVVTSQEGTFLIMDNEIIREWLVDVMKELEVIGE